MAGDVYGGPIRLVIFDVDGVLTDGTLYVDAKGEALKAFNVHDGLAVALLKAHGLLCGVLSGKASAALDCRVAQLKFDVAVTGKLEKLDAYEEIKRTYSMADGQIAYVGDDVVDLPLAGRVGCFYAPADAHPLVLMRADRVVKARGGRGVAREVAEDILQSGGLGLDGAYAPLLGQWERQGAVQ